jgi:hypothetical protein
VPSDAAGVVLNVTAVDYLVDGWVTVFPNGQSVPSTSTVNFDQSEYAIANGAIVRIGGNGQVCANVGTVNSAAGSSDVILDVSGYVTQTGINEMVMLTSPQRVVDTRSLGLGPIATGTMRCFTMTGRAGIPTNATGLVLNVTAVGYATRGWVTVYPGGQSVPPTSTLNFDPSEYAIANGMIVGMSTNGQVCVQVGTVNALPGSAHVILDVAGYLLR